MCAGRGPRLQRRDLGHPSRENRLPGVPIAADRAQRECNGNGPKGCPEDRWGFCCHAFEPRAERQPCGSMRRNVDDARGSPCACLVPHCDPFA